MGYTCTCEHGTPATGGDTYDCNADGTTTKCVSCNEGWQNSAPGAADCALELVGNIGNNMLRIVTP